MLRDGAPQGEVITSGDPIVSRLPGLWVSIVSVYMGADADFRCSHLFLCI